MLQHPHDTVARAALVSIDTLCGELGVSELAAATFAVVGTEVPVVVTVAP